MPAGRPLEPAGNGRPRWMTAGRDAARRPVHRIRLTGQLVRAKSATYRIRTGLVDLDIGPMWFLDLAHDRDR
jgi:hypothetical protein